ALQLRQNDDARRLREQALEALRDAANADEVVLVRCAHAGGGARVSAVDAVGDGELAERARRFVDRRFREEGEADGWTLQRPPGALFNRFSWAHAHAPEWQTFGVETPARQLRGVLYVGDALLGYLVASFALPVCDPR